MVYQFEVAETSRTYLNVKADSLEDASKALDIYMSNPNNFDDLIFMLNKGFEGLETKLDRVMDDSDTYDCDIDAEEVLE